MTEMEEISVGLHDSIGCYDRTPIESDEAYWVMGAIRQLIPEINQMCHGLKSGEISKMIRTLYRPKFRHIQRLGHSHSESIFILYFHDKEVARKTEPVIW